MDVVQFVVVAPRQHIQTVHPDEPSARDVSIRPEQLAVLSLPADCMGVVDDPCHYFPGFPAKRRAALRTPHLVAPADFVNRGGAFGAGFRVAPQEFDGFDYLFVAFVFFLVFQRNPAAAADGLFAQITIKLGINEPFTVVGGAGADEMGDDFPFGSGRLALELIDFGLDCFRSGFCFGEESG